MPAKGTAGRGRKFTAAEKSGMQMRLLELRAEGWSWSKCAKDAGVALRTFNDWRQRDERFALMCAAADGTRKDVLVDDCLEMSRDPDCPAPQRAWMKMFLVKQADPSFRDNHKVEHVMGDGLAASLKQLARLGRASEG